MKEKGMSETLAYYAAAEPKLLKLRDEIPTMARGEIFRAITDLVGTGRYHKDYDSVAAKVPCPEGKDPGLWGLAQWEKKYPLGHVRHRLYGHASAAIVAESLGVLTPEEIEWFRRKGNIWVAFVAWGFATKKPKAA